ncbi:50S ribosomal protein L25 [Candidatus Poribacteria bacterium]|nr:50S ribosomal protein L25 [Candidatus Poribacteria bacterium]
MQQVRFEAQKRSVFGKGAARTLRRAGNIPGVLYGRHEDVIPLQFDEQSFQRFLRSHGENILIDLDIADHGLETVIIKEVRRHPVKRNLLHTDFIRVSLAEPVTSTVPIALVGSAPGVRDGGVLSFTHRHLLVRCLPTLLPNEVNVEVSELRIDSFIRVGDLSLPEDIEVLDDPQTMIALVSPPKVEAAPATVEGAVAAAETPPEEPKVISRKRGDEEKK